MRRAALAALVLASAIATVSASPRVDQAAVDAFVDGCVSRYKIPGLSLAWVEDGKAVFVKGYGEASRGAAATPDTRYVIGSTSKMFTALAVLKLVDEGRVELDAPYKRYVPEFELAKPGEAERISVRHLLNMASGLSDRGLAPLSEGEASPEAELARLRKASLAAEPGKLYHYYSINYRLLALLVERVSGRSFEGFVEGEVFAPIGMSSSRSGLSEKGEGGRLPRAEVAQGYGVFLGLPIALKQEIRVSSFASGMMVSTARDIGKYLEAAIAVSGGGPAVGALSAASLESAWTAPRGAGYGMGWMVMDGGARLFHAGALENYQSAFFLDPRGRRGFAILMNQGGISAQASLNALRDGLFDLMEGRAPAALKHRPSVTVFAFIFFLALALSAFRIARLKAWRRRSELRARRPGASPARDWIVASLGLASALFLVFGLIPLGNAVMGDYTDWVMISGLAPDALSALPIILAGALVVATYKFLVLARRGRA
jgi:CubicO group peptidase (beta-lactamase class C family)